jgi:hypothetical protein
MRDSANEGGTALSVVALLLVVAHALDRVNGMPLIHNFMQELSRPCLARMAIFPLGFIVKVGLR